MGPCGRLFFYWGVCITLWIFSLRLSAGETKITLQVGEQKEITLPPFAEIKLSRKGMVDVRLIPPEKILLTGLRKGFLIIYVLGIEPDAPLESLHVTVTQVVEEPVPKAAKRLIALSQEAGLRCRGNGMLISGETKDYEVFFHIKNLCAVNADCSFFAQLNQHGLAGWEKYLRALLATTHEITFSSAGSATVLVPCIGSEEQGLAAHKARFDALSQGLVTNKTLVLQCRHHAALESYHLAAKVVQVSGTRLKEWGADAFSLLKGALSAETLRAPADPYLKSLAHDSEIKIIGEPIVKISSGRPAVIISGGEILAAREFSRKIVRDPKDLWKTYGLQLEVTSFPLGEKQLMLAYKLSFKQPSKEKDTHLRGSALESTVVLLLDQAEIVGSVSVQSFEKNEKSLPILQQIPLLGPIFRLVSNEDAQCQLFLWLRLTQDLGGGLPPGIPAT